MAGEDNLKRGPIPPKGRGTMPGANGGTLKTGDWRDEKEAQEAPIRDAVIEDPDKALEIVTGSLTVGVHRLTERWLREGGSPSKQLVDALREFRQSLASVVEARKARGQAAEAEEFFASLQARLDEVAPHLEARARPLVDVAS